MPLIIVGIKNGFRIDGWFSTEFMFGSVWYVLFAISISFASTNAPNWVKPSRRVAVILMPFMAISPKEMTGLFKGGVKSETQRAKRRAKEKTGNFNEIRRKVFVLPDMRP